MINLYLDCWNI